MRGSAPPGFGHVRRRGRRIRKHGPGAVRRQGQEHGDLQFPRHRHPPVQEQPPGFRLHGKDVPRGHLPDGKGRAEPYPAHRRSGHGAAATGRPARHRSPVLQPRAGRRDPGPDEGPVPGAGIHRPRGRRAHRQHPLPGRQPILGHVHGAQLQRRGLFVPLQRGERRHRGGGQAGREQEDGSLFQRRPQLRIRSAVHVRQGGGAGRGTAGRGVRSQRQLSGGLFQPRERVHHVHVRIAFLRGSGAKGAVAPGRQDRPADRRPVPERDQQPAYPRYARLPPFRRRGRAHGAPGSDQGRNPAVLSVQPGIGQEGRRKAHGQRVPRLFRQGRHRLLQLHRRQGRQERGRSSSPPIPSACS